MTTCRDLIFEQDDLKNLHRLMEEPQFVMKKESLRSKPFVSILQFFN